MRNGKMSNAERINWLDSMTWQVEFYLRTGTAQRKDPEFEWRPYERSPGVRLLQMRRLVRHVAWRLGLHGVPPMSIDWLRENASLLWDARAMLADDLSRLLFDSALVLRMTSHRRYYFPRIDFESLLEMTEEHAFSEPGFPHDYLGVPLGVFDVRLCNRTDLPALKIITRRIQLQLMNTYRQYLVRRNGFSVAPVPGDIVLDCGSCIGEISLLFAGLVAPTGQVHLFDPIALHTRFCDLQASLNPAYASMLHINTLAVGDHTRSVAAQQTPLTSIAPGAVSTDDFSCTTIDDYAADKLSRVDYIKMDIEGSEMAALNGASSVIREFRPRLAISGYHKPQDLWEIPNKLKDLNPGYAMAFGHHTPIVWESVFYAAHGSQASADRRPVQ